jgi:hypothetical protein
LGNSNKTFQFTFLTNVEEALNDGFYAYRLFCDEQNAVSVDGGEKQDIVEKQGVGGFFKISFNSDEITTWKDIRDD